MSCETIGRSGTPRQGRNWFESSEFFPCVQILKFRGFSDIS
jgi:hypothetical protein